jgi:hypothetical protein
MKKSHRKQEPNQELITLGDFLKSYNKTIPDGFPKASTALLNELKNTHLGLFKHGEFWSLDEHRKKVIDWLPPRALATSKY